jgi:hypothetical protein
MMVLSPAVTACVCALCSMVLCALAGVGGTCNATMYTGKSIGGNAYRQLKGSTVAACCAACVADPKCAAFVTADDGARADAGHGECLLKADLQNLHAKATNDCGVVRGKLGPPGPTPPPPPVPPGPAPPLPPGSPRWEVVEAGAAPVIGPQHPDVLEHSIQSGFETGQFFRLNGTYYYTANELGTCAHPGILWDLVTRAALWSAEASSGPWRRVLTLRNGSHMDTVCRPSSVPCTKPCGDSCCSGDGVHPSFVTWAPTLIHAPSSVNASGKAVWNFFYSSNQNSHKGDGAFNGITWAVSTTESMLGPYVDVVPGSVTGGVLLPAGAEGVTNVAVNQSHSFSAWKLRNGSWAGFKNNIRGAASFSAGLIVPAGDPTIPGGPWKPAGPNLASGSNCSAGMCFAPENPVVTTMSTDGKFYLAVYDALHGGSDVIGLSFSADGFTWQYSQILAVQTHTRSPCGNIRTPLGLVPEPSRCKGCYSVLWTGSTKHNFRPVCHAIIRNLNE